MLYSFHAYLVEQQQKKLDSITCLLILFINLFLLSLHYLKWSVKHKVQ